MNAETEQSTEPTPAREDGLRSLLNAVVDVVLAVEEDGTVADVNAAAEALLGLPHQAVVGAPLVGVVPALAPYLPIDALCARGCDGVSIEIRAGSGAVVPAHVVADEAHTASRKRYIVVLRDGRRIDGALERLLRGQRLVAVDAAMSALTHDVRNILQHMQSCLTLIALRGNDEVKTLAEDMQRAQDRLQRIFEDARSIAAPIRLERRLADVRKIIERAWRALRLRWSKKALTLAIDADRCADPRAYVDPRLLGQALRGVLEHAIEVAPQNGAVVCSMSGDGGERLEIAVQGAGVELTAELDGQPIDFSRSIGGKGAAKALAMAQRLIKEHDGDLHIEAPSSGASRLVIVLPQQSAAS